MKLKTLLLFLSLTVLAFGKPGSRSQKCIECHQDIYKAWKNSHHANANRIVSEKQDAKILQSLESQKAGENTYIGVAKDGELKLKWDWNGKENRTFDTFGVIGTTPLQQYILEADKGRYQVSSLAYDPHQKDWFYVFGDDVRNPKEWGHWTRQGMNWNANCAYCHMTDYDKNYDLETDSYKSTWDAHGIQCIQCHGDMPDHADGKNITKLSAKQTMHSCATCHSRREEFTDNGFKPGDDYHDFYRLSLPDTEGLYYDDGQVLEEDFVFGSFNLSGMHHAGVTCLDCHNPHTLETILPVDNNALCMRCHTSGTKVGDVEAPIIQPEAHSHHKSGSTGNQCVSCHMPETNYMVRDPRRDHGFLNPDPLMTKEMGIPNACNRCHTDKDTDWAVKHSEEWYGEKLENGKQRKRTRLIRRMRENDLSAIPEIIKMAESEKVPGWIATLTGLLTAHAARPEVEAFLLNQLDHPSPMVQSKAVIALSRNQNMALEVADKLDSRNRMVRIDTAIGLSTRMSKEEKLYKELEEYMTVNADRPVGALRLAQHDMGTGNLKRAAILAENSQTYDPSNSQLYLQTAIILQQAGENDKALRAMNKAIDYAKDDKAYYLYTLALFYTETNNENGAIDALHAAIEFDNSNPRLYYNLSLLYHKQSKLFDARETINKGLKAHPNDADLKNVKAFLDQF